MTIQFLECLQNFQRFLRLVETHLILKGLYYPTPLSFLELLELTESHFTLKYLECFQILLNFQGFLQLVEPRLILKCLYYYLTLLSFPEFLELTEFHLTQQYLHCFQFPPRFLIEFHFLILLDFEPRCLKFEGRYSLQEFGFMYLKSSSLTPLQL